MPKKTAELRATRTVLQSPLEVGSWSEKLRRSAEGEVALTATVSSTLHTLADGFTERMGFREEVDESALYARVLGGLLDREEIRAVARVDEVVLDRRRHAAVLVLSAESWELATRPFGEGEAQVGVLHGDWSIERGAQLEDLPERVRPWVDDGGTPLSELDLHAPTPVEPSVDIQLATAELVRPVPDDPQQVLQVFLNAELARHCDPMLKRAMLLVWLVRGQTVELWFLRNLRALGLDDLCEASPSAARRSAVAPSPPPRSRWRPPPWWSGATAARCEPSLSASRSAATGIWSRVLRLASCSRTASARWAKST